MKRYSISMDRGMSRLAGDRLIEWLLPVAIRGPGYTGLLIQKQSFMNSVAEVVSRYAKVNSPDTFSEVSMIALPDLMLQQTLLHEQAHLIFRIAVSMSVSDQFPSSVRHREKQSMLEVPSRIDFAGSTGTIRHTLALNYSVLSLCSDAVWREMQPSNCRLSRIGRSISVDWATLTDLSINAGNQEVERMSVFPHP